MVDSSVCKVKDVMDSVRASTQVQEEKAESLDAFRREVEGFLADVVRIGQTVRDKYGKVTIYTLGNITVSDI